VSETPEKSAAGGISGKVVVIGFLVLCFVLAAISLLVTLSGQWFGPEVEPEPPPEIGHELVPRQ